MIEPWKSRKIALSQWERSWALKPMVSITCPCGYKIDVPDRKLPAKQRYDIMKEQIETHRPKCPIWQKIEERLEEE